MSILLACGAIGFWGWTHFQTSKPVTYPPDHDTGVHFVRSHAHLNTRTAIESYVLRVYDNGGCHTMYGGYRATCPNAVAVTCAVRVPRSAFTAREAAWKARSGPPIVSNFYDCTMRFSDAPNLAECWFLVHEPYVVFNKRFEAVMAAEADTRTARHVTCATAATDPTANSSISG